MAEIYVLVAIVFFFWTRSFFPPPPKKPSEKELGDAIVRYLKENLQVKETAKKE